MAKGPESVPGQPLPLSLGDCRAQDPHSAGRARPRSQGPWMPRSYLSQGFSHYSEHQITGGWLNTESWELEGFRPGLPNMCHFGVWITLS